MDIRCRDISVGEAFVFFFSDDFGVFSFENFCVWYSSFYSIVFIIVCYSVEEEEAENFDAFRIEDEFFVKMFSDGSADLMFVNEVRINFSVFFTL